jgi:hypothetical protein
MDNGRRCGRRSFRQETIRATSRIGSVLRSPGDQNDGEREELTARAIKVLELHVAA